MTSSISYRLCSIAARRFFAPRLAIYHDHYHRLNDGRVTRRCLTTFSSPNSSSLSARLIINDNTSSIIDVRRGRRRGQIIGAIRVENYHVSAARWKKKSKKKKTVEESESEEEDEESESESSGDEEDALASDYRLVECPVTSLRVDSVAKVGLGGLPRTAVEQLMYEGKIRVDGQLCRKKGALAGVGTTIDLLLEASADNPDFSNVKRIVVDKISDRSDNQGRVIVTVKKWASLVVDDYKLGNVAKGDE